MKKIIDLEFEPDRFPFAKCVASSHEHNYHSVQINVLTLKEVRSFKDMNILYTPDTTYTLFLTLLVLGVIICLLFPYAALKDSFQDRMVSTLHTRSFHLWLNSLLGIMHPKLNHFPL